MGGTASRPDDYIVNLPQTDGSDGLPASLPGLLVDDRDETSLNAITPTDFRWSFGGHSVYVTGAWDDWRVKAALSQVTASEFSTVLALPVGTFQYKFIVDGNWKYVNPGIVVPLFSSILNLVNPEHATLHEALNFFCTSSKSSSLRIFVLLTFLRELRLFVCHIAAGIVQHTLLKQISMEI